MKTKISAYQLFAAMVLVPYGTAVLFLINPKAKQDAWITMLIYILPAIVLQLIYLSLWNKYPKDTIVTYMPKIFGKFLGYIISSIYIIFFTYEAARVLRDFEELVLIAVHPKMSITLIAVLLIFMVIYGTYKGLENICRVTFIIFCLVIIFFIVEWIALAMTPNALKLYNLRPVFEEGIVSETTKSWRLITFPYGESILFTMIFSSVSETYKVKKAAVMGVIVGGVLLSLNTIMFISVLGVDMASTTLFPLLYTFRIINVGDLFNRLDLFIILTMVVGGFVKASFYIYGSIIGTAELLKLKDRNIKYLSISIGIIVLITSLLIAENYSQHIYAGQVLTLTYIHLPLAVIIPPVALLVYYIKCMFKNK